MGGARKPNETPIVTVDDAIKLLEPIKLKHRLIKFMYTAESTAVLKTIPLRCRCAGI